MAYLVFCFSVILLVLGAVLFLALKCDEHTVTPEQITSLIQSGDKIIVKVYIRKEKTTWKRNVSKAKSVK
ncbi:MAG: hypothetical protein LUG52_01455 [Clostridia bacterium]|nr:hypothetical protein [Clostridia bacterium]